MSKIIKTVLISLALAIYIAPIFAQTGTLQNNYQNNTGQQPGGAGTTETIKKICDYAGAYGDKCTACMDKADTSVWTAIGCVPATPQGLIDALIPIGIGVAGGIAFLLILVGGFQIMTSAGNPEQLTAGKELVGSAIIGLLLIMFSVFILGLIGVNVLGLPGFTFDK